MNRRLLGLACLVALAASTRADEFKAVLVVKGHVTSSAQVGVSASTSAFVSELRAEVGDRVKKGQILAALDDGPAKVELHVAQAKATLAEARLAGEKSASTLERSRSELQLKRAKLQLDRLKKAGSVTPAELEAAQLDVDEAQLRLKVAADDGKLAILKAEWEVARAELERATRIVEATRLRAPMDGQILQRFANVGQFVRPGDVLVEIADVTKLVAVVDVPEVDLPKIALGQPCRLSLPTGNQALTGTVASISPVSDRATNTVQVKVEFPPGNGLARIGSVVLIAFLKPEK